MCALAADATVNRIHSKRHAARRPVVYFLRFLARCFSGSGLLTAGHAAAKFAQTS